MRRGPRAVRTDGAQGGTRAASMLCRQPDPGGQVPTVTAAVWNGGGQPLQLEQLRLVEVGEREVRVRLRASGVCHSDYHVVKGEWARRFPAVLGHEGAGVVEECGPGVTAVAVGAHVVLSWKPYCGACPQCLRGRYVLCEGATRTGNLMGDARPRLWRGDEPVASMAGLGTFAEQTVVPDSGVVPIDRSLPFEIAAIVGCAVTTGVGAVLNTARVEPGASVLVVGCGGVGLNVIQGAVLAGATTIIAADVIEAKVELAAKFGATHTVPAADLPAQVGEIVKGGADYAFDVTGNADVLAQAFAATQPGGTTVMVGSPPSGATIGIAAQA